MFTPTAFTLSLSRHITRPHPVAAKSKKARAHNRITRRRSRSRCAATWIMLLPRTHIHPCSGRAKGQRIFFWYKSCVPVRRRHFPRRRLRAKEKRAEKESVLRFWEGRWTGAVGVERGKEEEKKTVAGKHRMSEVYGPPTLYPRRPLKGSPRPQRKTEWTRAASWCYGESCTEQLSKNKRESSSLVCLAGGRA